MYVFRYLEQSNSKLFKAYWAIKITRSIHNEQNMFDNGLLIVLYVLRRNIVKSIRHLNVFKFPKMVSYNFLII